MRGISVTLIVRTQKVVDNVPVYDDTDRPIYVDTEVVVDDVLVGSPSSEDIISELNISGKRIAYTLAIPKGDTHIWYDTDVILPEPFAGRYRTIGIPTAGIDANIPLRWNKKVKLERYV